MRFLLRLYYPDDTDLIMLRERLGSDFPSQVCTCLRSDLQGFPYKIDCSTEGRLQPDAAKDAALTIWLLETRDKEVINYLRTLPPGYRNLAVKSSIREHRHCFFLDALKKPGLPHYRLSLSPPKDIDLIAAYIQLGNDELARLAKMAIRKAGREEKKRVPVYCGAVSEHRVFLEIPLDPVEDSDILTFFSSLLPHLADSCIKILLREVLKMHYEPSALDPVSILKAGKRKDQNRKRNPQVAGHNKKRTSSKSHRLPMTENDDTPAPVPDPVSGRHFTRKDTSMLPDAETEEVDDHTASAFRLFAQMNSL